MPWHQDFTRFTHQMLALWGSSVMMTLLLFAYIFRITPAQVYNKLSAVESQLQITTDSSRTATQITQSELNNLKAKTATQDTELKKISEKLKKLETLIPPEPKAEP